MSAVVNEVIALADAISTYWSTELPKRHPNYPLVNPGEDSGPPPPEELTLVELLGRQPEDVLYCLLLIMRLGRGDFGTDDLAGHYEDLKRAYTDPERVVAQLATKPWLADYIRDGLSELRTNGLDVDWLNKYN